ncbi:MAG: hypothetical protein SFY67_04395 [Candidatus Melainabacteria bacterium]|nr:hypothetical protein [Candidatus Melainabacteria bacterium]
MAKNENLKYHRSLTAGGAAAVESRKAQSHIQVFTEQPATTSATITITITITKCKNHQHPNLHHAPKPRRRTHCTACLKNAGPGHPASSRKA